MVLQSTEPNPFINFAVNDRALARSPRSPPIATSFAVSTPPASACVVFPSTFASPAWFSAAYPTLARSCASSRAASAAFCALTAAVAEEDAAFFEARADVSDVFAALADAAASPAFVVAVPADEAALFFDARAEASLAFAASTLAFTSTANWFNAGISVLFRSSLTIFFCAFRLLNVSTSNRS